ncbi:hypothetical protein HKCCE3408_08185 [Rhodobacterales bacterium HKCCE3408]|nr:hypothetical protein [Rhodobacterales bacterium HKCCE3408]
MNSFEIKNQTELRRVSTDEFVGTLVPPRSGRSEYAAIVLGKIVVAKSANELNDIIHSMLSSNEVAA